MIKTETSRIFYCDRCGFHSSTRYTTVLPEGWKEVAYGANTTTTWGESIMRHLCPSCSSAHSRFFTNKTVLGRTD